MLFLGLFYFSSPHKIFVKSRLSIYINLQVYIKSKQKQQKCGFWGLPPISDMGLPPIWEIKLQKNVGFGAWPRYEK